MPEDFQRPHRVHVHDLIKFKQITKVPEYTSNGKMGEYFPRNKAHYSQMASWAFNPSHRNYIFSINRPSEFQSQVLNLARFRLDPPHSPLQKQIRMTIHGHVFPWNIDNKQYQQMTKEGFKLPARIQVPGYEPREIEILVKPTFTIFVNLNYRD